LLKKKTVENFQTPYTNQVHKKITFANKFFAVQCVMDDLVIPLLANDATTQLNDIVGLRKMQQELCPHFPLVVVMIAHDYLGADVLLDDSRIEHVPNVSAVAYVCISNSLFQQVTFDDCCFEGVVFDHVIFLHSSFLRGKFEDCCFLYCTFWHVDVHNAVISSCDFLNCVFEDANMHEMMWKNNSCASKSCFLNCNFKLTRFFKFKIAICAKFQNILPSFAVGMLKTASFQLFL
jgi:uncharacterized protein YjbI with pentapeptide repeats